MILNCDCVLYVRQAYKCIDCFQFAWIYECELKDVVTLECILETAMLLRHVHS